jgi:tRNA (cmo5U34)-methyltransferase
MQPPPAEPQNSWGEEQSRQFLDWGRYFVPERERQLRTIAALLPRPDEPYTVLEVACGEGLLGEAILEAHPAVTVYGLDGSEAMLRAARRRLERFGERFQAGIFDLFARSWPRLELPVRGVVSALAIHHLDGQGKADLFREVFSLLEPGGMLVVADVIAPAGATGWELAAGAWDEAVQARSLELDGDSRGFEAFQSQRWNMYRFFDPQDIDHPSPLFEQLKSLEAAGFAEVDVYWMLAGHAIFGGRKTAG